MERNIYHTLQGGLDKDFKDASTSGRKNYGERYLVVKISSRFSFKKTKGTGTYKVISKSFIRKSGFHFNSSEVSRYNPRCVMREKREMVKQIY